MGTQTASVRVASPAAQTLFGARANGLAPYSGAGSTCMHACYPRRPAAQHRVREANAHACMPECWDQTEVLMVLELGFTGDARTAPASVYPRGLRFAWAAALRRWALRDKPAPQHASGTEAPRSPTHG